MNRRQIILGSAALAISAPQLSFAELSNVHKSKKALIIVSLADNEFQGIVPIPKDLGNGQNPATNLYWGAMYGVKSYFKRHDNYTVVQNNKYRELKGRLDAITLLPKDSSDYTIDAFAIDGRVQQSSVSLFYSFLTGSADQYDLVVFMGHNALMEINNDFPFDNPNNRPVLNERPKAAVIACASKSYFKDTILDKTNAIPYVLTNGNMAPEAYVLDGILEAWMNNEGPEAARLRAAQKYAQYQKIPLKNAKWLFKDS